MSAPAPQELPRLIAGWAQDEPATDPTAAADLLADLDPVRHRGHEVIVVDGGSRDDTLSQVVGRADRIMFSSAGRSMLFFWTWRGDRFFKP